MEKFAKKDKFINYEVIRTTKKKEYYLTDIKEGVVYLSVPEYATDKDIKLVLNQQFLNLYYKIHAKELYILHFKGKRYSLKCLKSTTDGVTVNDEEIIIKAVKVTSRYYKSVLNKFFAKVITEELEKIMDDAKRDFKEMVIPQIVIKPISGCFGRYCGDHVEISPVIAKYHPKYLKVLLYHELCHAFVRGHRDNFWKLLNSKLENGEKFNKEMKTINYNNDYL